MTFLDHTPTYRPRLSEAFEAALRKAHRERWASTRDNGKTLLSQATLAAETLCTLWPVHFAPLTPETVPESLVRSATASWYHGGLSPATITKRLNCLSVLGVNVKGTRPRLKPALKWWLKPEEQARAIAYLTVPGPNGYFKAGKSVAHEDLRWVLADLIRWTTSTGLRIEESLRLTVSDFGAGYAEVTVPGLKTHDSQATLALSHTAQHTAARRALASFEPRLFPFDYKAIHEAWLDLRTAMGWPDTATLKALRRTAARHLHIDCKMPLDMVRQYLRHESIDTTMEYLRLTGGYGVEEQRKFLAQGPEAW